MAYLVAEPDPLRPVPPPDRKYRSDRRTRSEDEHPTARFAGTWVVVFAVVRRNPPAERFRGYVREANERIYRFPVTVIDLATGASRDLELCVPLEKQLDRPSTNVSEVDGSLYAHGTWLMAITALEVDDAESALRIVCGVENSSANLEFGLGGERLGSGRENR